MNCVVIKYSEYQKCREIRLLLNSQLLLTSQLPEMQGNTFIDKQSITAKESTVQSGDIESHK